MSRFHFSTIVALMCGVAVPAASQSPGSPRPAANVSEGVSVSREEARQTAAEMAQKLEDAYVFPDVARRYAAMLRANIASSTYDGFTSAAALAQRLTSDLQAVSADRHLRVTVEQYVPTAAAVDAANPATAGPAGPPLPWKPIEEARWLTPDIAYIRFNVFPGDNGTVAAARQFMIDHAEAKVIIFDNRTHHGGGLDEMNAMFPYLFSKRATLVTMETRASVDRAQGSPFGETNLRRLSAGSDVVRREHYVVPSTSEKRLFRAKVFVLTSGATASAAEHMTLALKHTHRATIIGEATAGAAHYGGDVPIGDKFSVFIPVGRSFDPDTGKDWEGDGIAPDVAVAANRALTEALVRSGLSVLQAERMSASVKPSGSMARRIAARPAAR